jgi:hypothetical protein
MRHFIWGRRFEIGLTFGTLALFEVAKKMVGPIGPDILGAAFVIALLTVPSLRSVISGRMIRNRLELRLQGVFWTCDVVGRSGALPAVKGIRTLPTGRVYLLELPTGLYLRSIEERLNELAVGLNVRTIRVTASRGTARYIELTVIRSDAFGTPIVSPLLTCKQTSLWDPVAIGIGEDGQTVRIGLVEHNLLIGGEPGSGKSVALSSIVGAAALDPCASLVLLDGKEVELSAWRDVADRFVGSSQIEAIEALEGLARLMNERYQQLAKSRQRKIRRNDVDGLVMVVIDELALYLRAGDKTSRDRFAELLRDLVARGRAAGIIVVAATQKPSYEVVPTFIRDLFSYRLAMRCSSRDASDTILGQGWAAQGFSATSIDSADRGVGLLLAEGGLPVQILTINIDDEQIDQLVSVAVRVRSQ